MANEFIIRKGFKSLQDSELTGSLNLSGNIVADGTVQAEFASNTSTAISGAFDSVSSSLASELLKNTTDTLTGDLTVTGTLTAQEFHTEFTSASIVYESGSTQFGDSLDDTHKFTGSLQVSGSLELQDNVRVKIGSGNDLQIYHDSSNTYINETGNGSLITQASDYFLRVGGTNNTNNALTVANSGQVTLLHANNSKLNTTSTGITVTGNLDVNGTEILVGNNDTRFAENNLRFKAASDAYIDQNTVNQAIRFRTSNASSLDTEAIIITGGGSVGVGTNSPTAKLHVYSTGNGELEVQRASGALINLQAQSALGTIGTDSNHPLYLKTNGGTRVAIKTSGYVGIGTTDPAELLHLYSVSNSGPEIRFQHPSGSHYIRAYDNNWNFLASGSVQAISIQNNGTTTFGANVLLGNTVVNPATGFADQSGIGLKESSTIPKIEVSSDDTALSLNRTTTGGAGVIADLRYESNVRHSFGTATSYMLGSVGIGSASPSSTLDVQTNSSAGIARISADGNGAVYSANGDVQLYTNNAAYSTSIYAANKGSLLFRVQNDGNVGIGTTSPQTHLDVLSNTHTKLRVRTSGVADASMEVLGYDAGVHIGDPTNGNRWAIWNDGVSTTSPLNFGSYALGTWYVPDSQVMTLTHDGNVGIGDTTPNARLHVSAPYPTYTDYGTVFYGGTTNNSSQNGIMLGSAGNALSGVIGSNLFIDGTTWSQTNTGRSTGWFSIVNTTVAGKTSGLYYRGYVKGSTSTVDRFSITENGNVLIGGGSEYSGTGVTSLTINNDSYPTLSLGSTSASRMSLIAYNSYNYLSSSNPFYFDTGKVGIGTTSASSVLQVHGQQKWYTTNADGNELRGFFNPGGSADPANFRLYDADGTNIWIDLYGDGRIYSKGLVTNWGTGTGTYTRTTYYHDTSNGLLFEGGRTTDSSTGTGITWKFTWRGGAGTGGGVQLVHGDSAWSALSSDERLKTKTADIENGLDAINALSPIKYKWNTDIGSESEREITGFTAQNVQSAIPDAVFASSQDEELGDILTYRQNYITAYLVKAVQELSAKNDQLQAEIDALKNA